MAKNFSATFQSTSWACAGYTLGERRSHTDNYNKDWDVKSETATAFLLASRRICFLVTAGHRITALNDTTAPPRRQVKAYVRVGLHRDDKSEAVLFPLSDLPRFHIDDEVLGLDYGAILLDRDAIGAATKLGNAPVRPGNWEGELELAIAMFRPQSPRTFLARSP